MAVWTLERITQLRQRGAALRERTPEPDPADFAAQQERHALLDADQSTTYAAGLYQGQQIAYNPEAATTYDSCGEITAEQDL